MDSIAFFKNLLTYIKISYLILSIILTPFVFQQFPFNSFDFFLITDEKKISFIFTFKIIFSFCIGLSICFLMSYAKRTLTTCFAVTKKCKAKKDKNKQALSAAFKSLKHLSDDDKSKIYELATSNSSIKWTIRGNLKDEPLYKFQFVEIINQLSSREYVVKVNEKLSTQIIQTIEKFITDELDIFKKKTNIDINNILSYAIDSEDDRISFRYSELAKTPESPLYKTEMNHHSRHCVFKLPEYFYLYLKRAGICLTSKWVKVQWVD